jgi:uncharacterized protein (DUF983 family)
MRSSADVGTGQVRRVLSRAIRMRCPSCGQAQAFASWFRMLDRCPVCHFWFERGEGYFIGATCVNMVAAIVIPAIVYVVVLLATWPNPPWLAASLLAVALAVLIPVAFYPFARVIWLALDLVFRPIEPAEYQRPRALD